MFHTHPSALFWHSPLYREKRLAQQFATEGPAEEGSAEEENQALQKKIESKAEELGALEAENGNGMESLAEGVVHSLIGFEKLKPADQQKVLEKIVETIRENPEIQHNVQKIKLLREGFQENIAKETGYAKIMQRKIDGQYERLGFAENAQEGQINSLLVDRSVVTARNHRTGAVMYKQMHIRYEDGTVTFTNGKQMHLSELIEMLEDPQSGFTARDMDYIRDRICDTRRFVMDDIKSLKRRQKKRAYRKDAEEQKYLQQEEQRSRERYKIWGQQFTRLSRMKQERIANDPREKEQWLLYAGKKAKAALLKDTNTLAQWKKQEETTRRVIMRSDDARKTTGEELRSSVSQYIDRTGKDALYRAEHSTKMQDTEREFQALEQSSRAFREWFRSGFKEGTPPPVLPGNGRGLSPLAEREAARRKSIAEDIAKLRQQGKKEEAEMIASRENTRETERETTPAETPESNLQQAELVDLPPDAEELESYHVRNPSMRVFIDFSGGREHDVRIDSKTLDAATADHRDGIAALREAGIQVIVTPRRYTRGPQKGQLTGLHDFDFVFTKPGRYSIAYQKPNAGRVTWSRPIEVHRAEKSNDKNETLPVDEQLKAHEKDLSRFVHWAEVNEQRLGDLTKTLEIAKFLEQNAGNIPKDFDVLQTGKWIDTISKELPTDTSDVRTQKQEIRNVMSRFLEKYEKNL